MYSWTQSYKKEMRCPPEGAHASLYTELLSDELTWNYHQMCFTLLSVQRFWTEIHMWHWHKAYTHISLTYTLTYLQDSFTNCKTFTIPIIRIAATLYTRHNLFAHPCSYYYLLSPSILFMHILFVLHFFILLHIFTLYFSFFTYVYIYAPVLLLFLVFLHCPLSGPDLIYVSLLIIPCII